MKNTTEGDLYWRITMFIYGLLCVAGGLFLAREAYNFACESSSVWINVAIAVGSLIILLWGLLLVAAGLFPKNQRLQSIVERLDGSNDLNLLSLVLAAPIYFLTKLIRYMSSDEN